MPRFIFLGPPGAGKGTQAEKVASSASILHISTGELLRNAVAQKTALGQQARSYMDKGELVPDKLVLDMVRERLGQPDAQPGWILDGFPRNVHQAESLDALLQEIDRVYDFAINLEVPDEVLIDRLLARGRADDNEKTIRRRLEVYREQTAPLIDFYRDRQQLKSVNGDRPIEEVTVALKQVAGVSNP